MKIWKKLPSKVVLNLPNLFFSVLPNGPKPAQITFSVPKKCLPARLLYNNFAYTCRNTEGQVNIECILMYRSRISYVINLTITLIAWRLYSTHGVLFIQSLHEWNKTRLLTHMVHMTFSKNTKTTAFQKIINAFIWVSHEKHNAQLKKSCLSKLWFFSP